MADGKPACVVLASDRVSMKKLAAAATRKAAEMAPPAEAERTTGYRVGGVSPFGQKKKPAHWPTRARRSSPRSMSMAVMSGLQARLASRRSGASKLGAVIADVAS